MEVSILYLYRQCFYHNGGNVHIHLYFLEKHLSMSGPQTVERGGVDFADACRQTVTGGKYVAAAPAINYGKPNHILMTKRARKAMFHNI